jgi:type I restriction enzyme M protein
LTKSNGERDFGDLHLIIDAYRSKKKSTDRGLQHFVVPKAEIIANEYDLSLSKYKEEVYKEVVYETPAVILDKLSTLETKIVKGIEELKAIF